MIEVLSHSTRAIPWALSTAGGSLRKTNKPLADVIPQLSACMIDAMALVQRLSGDHKMFAEVGRFSTSWVLHDWCNSKKIGVVFDVCEEYSIKNAEREKRGAESRYEFRNFQHERKVQQWRKFILSPKNKKTLPEFVVKEWRRDKYRKKLKGKVLFVTCESDRYEITLQTANIVEDLNSTQEEADIRLILHAAHAPRITRPWLRY